jgi:putative redox protein
MKLKLNKVQGTFGMQAENEDGQTMNFDANSEIGGEGFGVRPMEAVAASLAACASIDVLLILKKQRIVLEDYQVDISANRQDAVPALFDNINLTYSFTGTDEKEKIQRAVDLSMEKYCSVSKILEPTCKITYTINLID